jgi:hypothetical protein
MASSHAQLLDKWERLREPAGVDRHCFSSTERNPIVTYKRVSPPILSLLCVGLWLAGCSDDTTGVDDEAGETTAASSTAEETDTTTDEGEDDSTSTTTDGDTSSSEEGNFIEMETDTTTDTPLGNLGEMCSTDGDCAEDLFCNGVPALGYGICSACGSDADCDGGNCTLTQSGYFECGDGSLGQMCETDEACTEGAYCAEVVDLGGLVNGNFCSSCKDDSHCMDGQLCAPMIEFMDLMNIGGQRSCVDPKSVPNDQVCDHEGNGDEACMGVCSTASLMGLIEIGVCGECETDADCMDGVCTPAELGFGGVVGSTCG